MNRIIIIGNGFDKAHGLLTGYKDFIDYYWRNVSNIVFPSYSQQILQSFNVMHSPNFYDDDFISIYLIEAKNLSHKDFTLSCDNQNPYSDVCKLINEYNYRETEAIARLKF